MQSQQSRFSRLQPTPLAASLAALFGLACPNLIANTIFTVANCQDAGAGSLRAALSNPVSNTNVDIDMTGLVCSQITLTGGEIVIQPTNTTYLHGPGANKLRIDGNGKGRVFSHHGAELRIYDLSIANGYTYSRTGSARGGCVFSDKVVYLNNTNVTGCKAGTYSGAARGGGIYALFLDARSSVISSCKAFCYSGGTALGGGAMVLNGLTTNNSTISNNSATCRPGGTAAAGAVYDTDVFETIISNSTIAMNSSSGDAGGLQVRGAGSSELRLLNSTISGNTAGGFVGGVDSTVTTNIYNSTIAFNSAGAGSPSTGIYRAAGLYFHDATLTLQSSLLAHNVYGSTATENDLSVVGATLNPASANNLVQASTFGLSTGNGNLAGVCPLLGPLRINGGPTPTHALLSHSPAIDHGNNPSGFLYDQRESPDARTSGPPGTTALADIGAYEVQQGDIVFNAGFDGCP